MEGFKRLILITSLLILFFLSIFYFSTSVSNNDLLESLNNIDDNSDPNNVLLINSTIVGPISASGFLEVELQDQHTEIIDLLMNQLIDNITLTSNYNIGDYFINVTSNTAPTTTVGEVVCLKEGVAFYQAHILSVVSLGGNAYTIELDSPLDYAFTTATNGGLSDTNWAVDASITPQVFKVTSGGLDDDVSWDITRMILICGGIGIGATNAPPDDSDFMVTDALTRGIVIRSVDGITKNIFNAKTNGQLRARTFDVVYTEKSKNGLYSTGTRRTFSGTDKNGVTIRLNAATNDSIELIVQDDLTEMTRCQMVVQGHVVEQ